MIYVLKNFLAQVHVNKARECRETSQLASYERFQSDRRHYLSPGCVSRQPHCNTVRYGTTATGAVVAISADLLPHSSLHSPSLSPTKQRRGKSIHVEKSRYHYHLVQQNCSSSSNAMSQ